MYMKRKIDGFLSEWKADPARKPLIIENDRYIRFSRTESRLLSKALVMLEKPNLSDTLQPIITTALLK